jgi:hypothetical protein
MNLIMVTLGITNIYMVKKTLMKRYLATVRPLIYKTYKDDAKTEANFDSIRNDKRFIKLISSTE